MDREQLYRFFEGNASLQEEQKIKNWLNGSDSHQRIFMQERMAYDALLLAFPEVLKKQKKSVVLSPWMISTAAAVALLVIISTLYLFGFNNSPQYNTILVPAGQRINLILADNTNVWLNANTSFRYPSRFSKQNRMVYLDGEAYFDVSKNKKPFIVKTGQGDIQVTGTSFNVEAYSRFDSFETSLFEGGVDIYKNKVKLASLKPNKKCVLENDRLSIFPITDTDDYLWRRGLIAFNNKKLEEILLSLEKYFDVEIQIDPKKLPQHTYSGKFRQSDGVDYALRVLQKSIRFTYNRDEETGTIYIQ